MAAAAGVNLVLNNNNRPQKRAEEIDNNSGNRRLTITRTVLARPG